MMQTYFRSVFLPILSLGLFLAIATAIMSTISHRTLAEMSKELPHLRGEIAIVLGYITLALYVLIVAASFYFSLHVILRSTIGISLLTLLVFGFAVLPFSEYLAPLQVVTSPDLSWGISAAFSELLSRWPTSILLILGKFLGVQTAALFVWALLNQMSAHEEGKLYYVPFAFVLLMFTQFGKPVSMFLLNYLDSTVQGNILLIGGAGALAVAFVLSSYLSSDDERLIIEDKATTYGYWTYTVLAGLTLGLLSVLTRGIEVSFQLPLSAEPNVIAHKKIEDWTMYILHSTWAFGIVVAVVGRIVLYKWGSSMTLRITSLLITVVVVVAIYSENDIAISGPCVAIVGVLGAILLKPIIFLTFTRVPKSVRFSLFSVAFLFISIVSKSVAVFAPLIYVFMYTALPPVLGGVFSLGTLLCAYLLGEFVLWKSRKMVRG